MPRNLIIGLSGPYGAGCSSLSEELKKSIQYSKCSIFIIRPAELIEYGCQIYLKKKLVIQSSPSDRRRALQGGGTELRKTDLSLVGKLITHTICTYGSDIDEKAQDNHYLSIFIIDCLKNTNDVSFLRDIYRNEFFHIHIHADRDIRWRREKDYKDWDDKDRVSFDQLDLIDSDEKANTKNNDVGDAGQQIRKLSSIADYYILNNGNRKQLRDEGTRVINLLFGIGHNQPTFHERAMHIAYSASCRSFCLSRQVGATLVDKKGNIIGIGHNDVPKACGGLYNSDDTHDHRCYSVGNRKCINDSNKTERYEKIINELIKELSINEAEHPKILKIFKNSLLQEATEYCRAVHAEMEALLSVCRTSAQSTRGSYMYVTTQPCHNCTKHIVAAGVAKVFYLEPYPKSLSEEFHFDSITFNTGEKTKDKVIFSPYQGVAPKNYVSMFIMRNERKDSESKFNEITIPLIIEDEKLCPFLSPRNRRKDQVILDAVSFREVYTYSEIGTKIKEFKDQGAI